MHGHVHNALDSNMVQGCPIPVRPIYRTVRGGIVIIKKPTAKRSGAPAIFGPDEKHAQSQFGHATLRVRRMSSCAALSVVHEDVHNARNTEHPLKFINNACCSALHLNELQICAEISLA